MHWENMARLIPIVIKENFVIRKLGRKTEIPVGIQYGMEFVSDLVCFSHYIHT